MDIKEQRITYKSLEKTLLHGLYTDSPDSFGEITGAVERKSTGFLRRIKNRLKRIKCINFLWQKYKQCKGKWWIKIKKRLKKIALIDFIWQKYKKRR